MTQYIKVEKFQFSEVFKIAGLYFGHVLAPASGQN